MADVNWKITKVDRDPMNGDHIVEATLTLSTEVNPFATFRVSFPAGTAIADVWVKLKAAADPYVLAYLEHGQYVTNLLNAAGTLTYP